jgi:hypothetical protein
MEVHMDPNRKRRLLLGSLAALAVVGRPLGAQQLAEGRTAQNLRFVTGGVGLDESEQMKALANEFSLTVVLAATSGAYLADTQVSIRDAQGTSVLNAHLNSPYLLVNLAAGRYDIEANYGGIRKQQRVMVGNSSRARVVFTFDVPVDLPRESGPVT